MRAFVAFVYLSAVAIVISCSETNAPIPAGSEPNVRVSIDSVAVLNGEYATLKLSISRVEESPPIDSIRSFDFRVSYNDSLLTFLDAIKGPAMSSWEYFTWRHTPRGQTVKTATVRVVGYRDLDNGTAHPVGQLMPEGELFRMHFVATTDREKAGTEPEVTFWSNECTENVLVDGANAHHLHLARDILSNSTYSQTIDTLNCERRYSLSPDIEFVSGAVKIEAGPLDPSPPLMTLTLDSTSGNAGDTAEVDVIASYRFHPDFTPLTLGAFSLALAYDTSSIRLVDVSQGPALEGWEYFSWRNQIRSCLSCPLYPGLEFVSIREMNNDSHPSTGFVRPIGVIARIRFILKRDLSAAESCDAYYFWANEVEHNVLSDEYGNVVYLPYVLQTGMRMGPDYDTTGCGVVVDTCEKIIDYLHVGCEEND